MERVDPNNTRPSILINAKVTAASRSFSFLGMQENKRTAEDLERENAELKKQLDAIKKQKPSCYNCGTVPKKLKLCENCERHSCSDCMVRCNDPGCWEKSCVSCMGQCFACFKNMCISNRCKDCDETFCAECLIVTGVYEDVYARAMSNCKGCVEKNRNEFCLFIARYLALELACSLAVIDRVCRNFVSRMIFLTAYDG